MKDYNFKINEYNNDIIKYNKKQKGGYKNMINENEILYMLLPSIKYD
jgi:hypothetical protein